MDKPENSTDDIVAQDLTDLKVTFATSLREHTRAMRAFMLRQTAGRIMYVVWLGVPLALMIYLILREPDPLNWWLGGGLVVAGAGALYAFPWLQALSIRKGQPDFYGPQITTLDEDGVHIQLQHSKIDLTWKAIYGARETSEFIFIQLGKNVSHFLPKRVLNEEVLSRIRRALRSHLGNQARVERSMNAE
jgi:hypothetical protein